MFYLELFLGFFFLWSKGIILLFTYTGIIHSSTLVQKKIMHRLQNEFQCSVFNPKPNSGFWIFSLKILLFGV